MRSAPRIILAGLLVPALAVPFGCRSGSESGKPSPSGTGAPAVRPASLPAVPVSGARAELETIRANYGELKALCAREELPFRTIEAKAWLMAGSADTLLRAAAFAGQPPEGQPEPAWLVDLDLISIDSKRLGLAAGLFDAPGVRENFGKLQLPCGRLFPAEAAPDAPPAPSGPQGAGKK